MIRARRLAPYRLALLLAALAALCVLTITPASLRPPPGAAAASGAELRLNPQAPVALAGVPLRLDLHVSGAQDLTGWSGELTFGADAVDFVSLQTHAAFLSSTGRSAICFGPGQAFAMSPSWLTSALDPGITTMQVSDVAPLVPGEMAIIEWIDYAPALPEAVTEGVTVIARNPNTSTPGFPGTITITRGTQLREDQIASGSGGGSAVTFTASALTDTAKNWTANQWVGAVVSAGGSRGVVASNTNRTLTLNAPWTNGTPAPGTPYMMGTVFPAGSRPKTIDHGRISAGCGTSWFSQDPPPGVNGIGTLATFTLVPGVAESSATFGLDNASLSNSTGTHPFTAYGASIDVVPCPSVDALPLLGFAEFLAMLAGWQSVSGDAAFNATLDLSRNDRIEFGDFLVLLAYWNQSCPGG